MSTQVAAGGASADLLREGRSHELAGRLPEAIESYAGALERAERGGDRLAMAEALRRLGVLHHQRAEPDAARDLYYRSHAIAVAAGAQGLAAEALNALGGFFYEQGRLSEAREHYRHALELAASDPALTGKVEQNLGVLASVAGEWRTAASHFERALTAAEEADDKRSCAIAYHNLGMIHADQKRWEEADRCFQASRRRADAAGDLHLEALARLNHAEVHSALELYDSARENAEAALRIFTQVDARRDKGGAHRVLGMIFRRTGRPVLAESHLRSAWEIALSTRCPLLEADAARELMELYHQLGRYTEAGECLHRARSLYAALGARHEAEDLEERAQRWEAM